MKNGIKNTVTIGLFLLLFHMNAFSQKEQSEQMIQMLDYSRPGTNHSLLGQLVGTWNFQDSKLPFVKGTLVRKPIYDGRFFSVEITGGKIQMPVADGKMKEDYYKSQQIEGYDNPRMGFYTSSINNHIGSDIQYQTGVYDAAEKKLIYDWDSELIKGKFQKDRRVIRMIDSSHYTETYFEQRSGQYIKVRELNYTKSGG